jgi:4-carboxymuconolactone decarboxylase
MPSFGRYDELPLDKMNAEQRAGYDHMASSRGGLPGPYKVWMHNPKLLHAASHLGAHFTPGGSTLNQREREIAVIVITSAYKSDYPNAAHERIGKEAGLPAASVEAMIAGLPTSFADPGEQCVYEMAVSLANHQVVSQGLHDRAVKLLGHEKITDIVVLMGYYAAVSMTMNFYAVPANTPGLSR